MTPFERLFAVMTKPWVAASYLGLIVLSFIYFDQPIAYYFYSLDLKTKLPILTWITNAGVVGVYFVSLLLLALFFRYIQSNAQWEARAWFLWLCVALPNLICVILKVTFGRARPTLLFSDELYGFYGLQTQAQFWSFPSGHTTTIMGLVFGLSIIFPRYCYAFLVSGFLVALSRVLLTNHFLSDVLTASYLTLLEVGLLLLLLRCKGWLQPAYNARKFSLCEN